MLGVLSAVSKHIHRKFIELERLGRKSCKSKREDWSIDRIQVGFRASRITKQKRVQEIGYKCHSWTSDRSILSKLRGEKRTEPLLSGPKSSFHIKVNSVFNFGNQGPRIWRKSGEAQNSNCLKSSMKFSQSVIICGGMSFAGVGPGDFWSLHPSVSWQALWRCFLLTAGTGTCPQYQNY